MESDLNFFSQLPFEICEMIFEYLTGDDLKSMMMIGARIRDVIVASPISMRKLKLYLIESWNEKVDFVKNFGECVRDVDFDYCHFENPEEFRDVFRCMRRIETVRLRNLHIAAETMNKKYKILLMKFHRLKTLCIDNSQAMGKLFRLYLKKMQVENLRLDFCHYNVTGDEIVELLRSQVNLKTLELAGFNNILYQSLFKHDISYTFNFQIEKLILNHRVVRHDLFLKFIKALDTLKSIEVYKEIEDEDFLSAIFQMNTLESLTLASHFVTLKNIDFRKVATSKLRELVLVTRSQYGVEQTINYLITKLGELRTLKIDNIKTDSSDQLLGCLHLKKLENLHITNSKLKFIQTMKFDNLQSLHLTTIHPYLKFEDWEKFFRSNRKIREISLKDFEVYYVIEAIKAELDKFLHNLYFIEKTLKRLEIHQELRYQKPMKLSMKIEGNINNLQVSDSFIKICREEFHAIRKMHNFHLTYFSDDHLKLNNKYLK